MKRRKRRRIDYSDAEMEWLAENRTLIISDYHRAFVKKFRRDDVEQAHLHGLRKRKGWLVGRDSGRFKGRRIKYSAEEIAWLRENRTLPISDCHREFIKAFPRDDVTPQNLHALRKREGLKTGRTGRFEKGAEPANKGKKMPFNLRRAATQFKPGQLPHNHQGAGHEQCLDGDKLNTDPANWELVPRAMLPRLNGRYGRGFDAAPDELKPTILAVTRLEHAAREKRREAAE